MKNRLSPISKVFFAAFAFSILITTTLFANAETDNIVVTSEYSKKAFPLFHEGKVAPIFVDTLDAEVVLIAARSFRNDIGMVVSSKPPIYRNKTADAPYQIIIGTLGQSELIDRLAKTGKINFDQIQGKWESFQIAVVDKPFKGVKKALVIAGSDRRGTAFGVFELSKKIGVSPWVWWADVMPKHQDALYLNLENSVYGPPSIKYRGIFLNDEDWGLKPWAAKNWDTDIEDIGPKTYAKIFELMLRLKANYLWPAMHDCTKAFYYYPENPAVADKYGIIVGSSHCEPLLRNNVFEWKENFKNEYSTEPGEWRYDLNKSQISTYWTDRAKQSRNYESIYTIGMRGIHDGSMPGPKDTNLKLKLLDTVITDQRLILSQQLGKPANQIPQIFCPYKEVLTLYQRGLKLPDDVTIVWADDNHGYIRQLSTPDEQKRSGGSGVYYHLSYWGSPHDYLWLSSISPSLISFELSKAKAYGADRLWVVNVGDIKPAEMELEFAMDMAWDAHKWTPLNAHTYAKDWAARTFGEEFANTIASIKQEYYKLAQNGKPEHLGQITFTEAEMHARINAYRNIAIKASQLNDSIPLPLKDAYYQLIFYPVYGALLMNEKIFYARMSLNLAQKGDSTALDYAEKAMEAFERIQILTKKYNEEIAGGKWNGMMSWKPRNLEVYKMPKVATDSMLLAFSKNPVNIKDGNKNMLVIPASAYTNKLVNSGNELTVFKGLGIDDNGIGILPYTFEPVADSLINQSTMLEYTVKLDTGKYTIRVKGLPTHTINKGRGVKYGISVNNSPIKIVDINSPAESAAWKKNVLQGFSQGETAFESTQSGESVLRIYLPEPGTILSCIEIEK